MSAREIVPEPHEVPQARSVPSTASQRRSSSDRAGWTLVAGVALVALGLATPTAPQDDKSRQTFVPPSFATSDSNGSMIAVTGVDITGASLLYVVDTESHQLSVYQATGGSSATAGVRWIGARRIDLDLQVDGWNDKSEHGYKDLHDQFEANGVLSDER